MAAEIETLLKVITQEDRDALLERWQSLNVGSLPRSLSTERLRWMIAYHIQEQQRGALSPSIRRRLKKALISKDAKCQRQSAREGTRFIREWNGISHVVDLKDGTYHWNGHSYRSLTAIARKITGAHWSGPRFFGLTKGQRSS